MSCPKPHTWLCQRWDLNPGQPEYRASALKPQNISTSRGTNKVIHLFTHIGNFSIFLSHTLYRAFTNSSGIFWHFCDGGTSGHAHHHLISASAFFPFCPSENGPPTKGNIWREKTKKQIYFNLCFVDIGPVHLYAQTHARTFQL